MPPAAMRELARDTTRQRRVHTSHFRNASKMWVPEQRVGDKVPKLILKEGAKACDFRASSVPTRAWMPLEEEDFNLDGTRSRRRGSVGASGTSNPSSAESGVVARDGPPSCPELSPKTCRVLNRVASETKGGVDSVAFQTPSKSSS